MGLHHVHPLGDPDAALAALGGRVLDPRPLGVADLPAGAVGTGMTESLLLSLSGEASPADQRFRRILFPVRSVPGRFVVRDLAEYDEEGLPEDRRATEAMIRALRAGERFPPLVVFLGWPGDYPAIDVLDGVHRAAAMWHARVREAEALELRCRRAGRRECGACAAAR